MSIFERFKRNIVDFDLVNDFIEEHMGKSFGYLMTGFGIFNVIFILLSLLLGNAAEGSVVTVVVLFGVIQAGFIIIMVLSLLAWLIAVVVKLILRTEVDILECYKIGIYSMTVPNILLGIGMLTNIQLPAFKLIYVGLIAFYAFKFLSNFIPEENTSTGMSDFLSDRNRNSEAE